MFLNEAGNYKQLDTGVITLPMWICITTHSTGDGLHKRKYEYALFFLPFSVCVFAHQCIAEVIYGPHGMGQNVEAGFIYSGSH